MAAPVPGAEAVQTHAPVTGLGSLEAARGSMHVGPDDDQLTRELTAFGTAGDPPAWLACDGWVEHTDPFSTFLGSDVDRRILDVT